MPQERKPHSSAQKNEPEKISKKNFSQWYHNLLKEAEIVDSRYEIQGMLVYRKWGLFIIREMQRCLESMLEQHDHEPVTFPVLIPETVLGKETRHIAGFEDEVFWVTHAGSNELSVKLALRPTSETPIYEMFSLWIRSYNDLPMKVHQSCAVYRYETKHTRPLIRGREFLWNEGHSAHVDYEDAEKNVADIKKIYRELIENLLCIPFCIDRRPEWDKFPGAEYTLAFDTIMPEGKILQIATVHNLGENFAHPFEITYEDQNGEKRYVSQTSYGPSFGRLLASVISIHGDDNGLVLPPKIAPLQIIIVPIMFKGKGNREEIVVYCREIENFLKNSNIRVKVDERDLRPGEMFYFWEMRGVPLRFEIGPREAKNRTVTAARRDNFKKTALNADDMSSLLNDIREIFTDIEQSLRSKAKERFESMKTCANSNEDIENFDGAGIISCGWCGEKSCAEQIEQYCDILGVEERADAVCPVCGGRGYRVRCGKTY